MDFKRFLRVRPGRKGKLLVEEVDTTTKVIDLIDPEDFNPPALRDLGSEIYDSKCAKCGAKMNSADIMCPVCAQFTKKGEEELQEYLDATPDDKVSQPA